VRRHGYARQLLPISKQERQPQCSAVCSRHARSAAAAPSTRGPADAASCCLGASGSGPGPSRRDANNLARTAHGPPAARWSPSPLFTRRTAPAGPAGAPRAVPGEERRWRTRPTRRRGRAGAERGVPSRPPPDAGGSLAPRTARRRRGRSPGRLRATVSRLIAWASRAHSPGAAGRPPGRTDGRTTRSHCHSARDLARSTGDRKNSRETPATFSHSSCGVGATAWIGGDCYRSRNFDSARARTHAC
jgi:hypothetical protein